MCWRAGCWWWSNTSWKTCLRSKNNITCRAGERRDPPPVLVQCRLWQHPTVGRGPSCGLCFCSSFLSDKAGQYLNWLLIPVGCRNSWWQKSKDLIQEAKAAGENVLDICKCLYHSTLSWDNCTTVGRERESFLCCKLTYLCEFAVFSSH